MRASPRKSNKPNGGEPPPRKIARPSPSTLLARQLTKSTALSVQISTLDTSADLSSAYFPRRST
jgi:hypothetical protein